MGIGLEGDLLLSKDGERFLEESSPVEPGADEMDTHRAAVVVGLTRVGQLSKDGCFIPKGPLQPERRTYLALLFLQLMRWEKR